MAPAGSTPRPPATCSLSTEVRRRSASVCSLLSAASLCLLTACACFRANRCEIDNVIFPASKAGWVARALDLKTVMFWNPANWDVSNAWPGIRAFLEKNVPAVVQNPEEYHGEFFGIIVDGNKRLFCNFVRRVNPAADRNLPAIVQLECDTASKQCFNLRIGESRQP